MLASEGDPGGIFLQVGAGQGIRKAEQAAGQGIPGQAEDIEGPNSALCSAHVWRPYAWSPRTEVVRMIERIDEVLSVLQDLRRSEMEELEKIEAREGLDLAPQCPYMICYPRYKRRSRPERA